MALAFWESITWRPSIGDPTVRGWLTAAALVVVGILVWRHAWSLRAAARPLRTFWWVTGGVLLILGITQQLGLQSLVTDVGRELLREQGWWEGRRQIQAAIVGLAAVVAVVVVAVAAYALGAEWRRCGIALLGLGWLAAFIVVRAASSHQVDEVLRTGAAGLDVKWAAEVIGLVLVYVGLVLDRRRSPTRTMETPVVPADPTTRPVAGPTVRP